MLTRKSWISLFSQFCRQQAKIKDPVLLNFMKKTIQNCTCKMNNSLTVMSAQFSRQVKGLVSQRLRRTIQIIKLYEELGYNRSHVKQLLQFVHQSVLKQKKGGPFLALFSAVTFNFKDQQITEEEVHKYVWDFYCLKIFSFCSQD